MSGSPTPASSSQEAPPSRGDEELRMGEYSEVVGMIRLLTDVRFKLAALIPALTGAAVAVIVGADDIDPLTQAVLGLGGFAFAVGIVIYDLRNSQIYNGAIGRATALEASLFDRYGGDDRAGLFGSRADTDDNLNARKRDRFLGFHIDHSTALTLVYTATLTAWVWVVLSAGADWLESLNDRADLGPAAAVLSVLIAVLLWMARIRLDPPKSQEVKQVRLTRDELAVLKEVSKATGKSYRELLSEALAIEKPTPELDSTHQDTTEEHSETIGLRVGVGQLTGQPDHQQIIRYLERYRPAGEERDHGDKEGP
jgi:hypothetical protein